MNTTLLWQLLLQLILILLNAIFASAEIAFITMNENRLAKLAEDGNKSAIRTKKLTSKPSNFLATIQVAITLSGFLGSAFAADNFSDSLVTWLQKLGVGIRPATLDTISVIAITLLLSYFTLVLGELVPKRIAMKKAEQLALGMSSFIAFISKLFAPIVWVLTKSTNAMLRMIGIDPEEETEEVSEEEIRLLVDVGSKNGVIDTTEQEFIHNIFEFDDLEVSEFATHRTDIAFLWAEQSIKQWEDTIYNNRYTLYPICLDSVDHIIGVLNVKDYFRLADKSKENVFKEAVKPAYFIPQTIRADVLFKQMKHSHNHFAVVLDEYGGVFGIVTMNDLLELYFKKSNKVFDNDRMLLVK